jgi:ankyrin repeat domain-containing protein 50
MIFTSPLFYASSVGLLKAVKELLAVGWDPNRQGHERSSHSAISWGHPNVMIELLTHGANVNAKDHLGYSPLHHAVKKGSISIVQLLFLFGAQASSKDGQGSTPLHLAAFHSHEQIAQFLFDK